MGKEGDREGEKHRCVKHQSVASCVSPIGVLAHNSGMRPAWESNWRSFSLWDDAQPPEPHQSGQEQHSWS